MYRATLHAWNNISLSFMYRGHLVIKCSSSSISFRHEKHFLLFLSILGLICLPFSINNSWLENLNRERVFLSFLFFRLIRYFSVLIENLKVMYVIAFGLLLRISLYVISPFCLTKNLQF